MKSERYVFPPFVVDAREGSLRRDSQEIVLRAKTFSLLCYFLARPGQLVSKDELLENVWAGTYVAEGALTVCINEIRKALGDDTKSPHYIATVTKRGYRFIAPVAAAAPVSSSEFNVAREQSERRETGDRKRETPQETPIVGRDADLAQLHSLFAKACGGQRQVIFVTGEPGIGKTTLVETSSEELEAGS